MVFNGFVECCDDDRCGDSGVCRDGEGVAGVVIEPGQDFLVKVRLSAQINSIVWSLVRVGVVFGRRDRGSNAVSPSVR